MRDSCVKILQTDVNFVPFPWYYANQKSSEQLQGAVAKTTFPIPVHHLAEYKCVMWLALFMRHWIRKYRLYLEVCLSSYIKTGGYNALMKMLLFRFLLGSATVAVAIGILLPVAGRML
ncbi:hypothetical protein D8Y20_01540 [Mariprofundus sp. EBB-1]|uniref:hypothetical protein n=1 Tax=Mariprofundus sp. EBB-1 TaxID=2650971 RepID=UPI000EF28FCD|nr:hypothetical protein [Mariprofundus sp. EBB-1]RLL55611.1 hypothetical protein D8Y20_01540 [Mariprofundus sp. EBB-1]